MMFSSCGAGEDSWESLGLQGDPTSQSYGKLVLNTHWEDWCWSWNSSALATWFEDLTHLKRPWCWERLKAGKGMTKDEMAGWHHQLNGHGFEQAPGFGDGQGSVACYSSWGCKESDTTERLNWTELSSLVVFHTFFNLSLNFAISSSWSEPQSVPSLVFADSIGFLHLWLQRI